jgi:pimeloyl-ACP methyl ester carboxylesterase
LIPDRPLFIPDLPGYGSSAPTGKNDKFSVGMVVIGALWNACNVLSDEVPLEYPPIFLIGHDRGARVAHALHAATGNSNIMGFRVVGLALMDIVPTQSQWEIGNSAAAQTGYFHWSFLANVSIAKPMIMAYGGGKWAIDMINRWAGTNAEGLEKLKSGDSFKVYSSFFDKESVVEASCLDYEAGATTDVDAEMNYGRNGQSIIVPLLLIYSAGFLMKRANKPIPNVWGMPWCNDPRLISDYPIGNGVGHFIPEEAPELVAKALLDWIAIAVNQR